MERAIISDIHGNLEALTAVLADIDSLEITDIVCLGDVVGYGPDPSECLNLLRKRARFIILGNHDDLVLRGAPDSELAAYAPHAADSIRWTASLIDWSTLKDCVLSYIDGDVHYFHASPDNNRDYLDARSAFGREMIAAAFSRMEGQIGCFGHTHIPAHYWLTKQGFEIDPLPCDLHGLELAQGTHLLNVGSVGQPQDRDWRACYVVQEDALFTYRRVVYDVHTTQQKLLAITGMRQEHTAHLADRLSQGN